MYRQINIGRLYLAIDFCNALCFTSLFHSANPVKIRGSCKNTQRFSHRQNHLGHQNQGQSKGCTKEPGLHRFSVAVSWAVRFVHEKKYRHLAKSFEQQRKLESKNKGREIVKQFIRNDSEWLTLIACTKRTTSQKILSQVTTSFSESTDQRGTSPLRMHPTSNLSTHSTSYTSYTSYIPLVILEPQKQSFQIDQP